MVYRWRSLAGVSIVFAGLFASFFASRRCGTTRARNVVHRVVRGPLARDGAVPFGHYTTFRAQNQMDMNAEHIIYVTHILDSEGPQLRIIVHLIIISYISLETGGSHVLTEVTTFRLAGECAL